MIDCQTWIWRHIRMTLPVDWTMLQYSKNPAQGRCVFADRYQYRFELDWRAVPSAPDVERMLSDLEAKLSADHEGYKAHRLGVGGWQGVWGNESGQVVSRLGRHLEDIKCLVEAVFIWPDRRDEACERDVLNGSGGEPPRDGVARWKAFGMDLRVPADLELAECRVQPAAVELAFAGAGRRRVVFARRGMVKQWLTGSVADWLEHHLPADVREFHTRRRTRAGHEIVACAGRTRCPGIGGRLRPRLDLEAEAWLCPESGRLLSVERRAPHTAEGEAGFLGDLRCCRAMEVSRG